MFVIYSYPSEGGEELEKEFPRTLEGVSEAWNFCLKVAESQGVADCEGFDHSNSLKEWLKHFIG
jgi:hypothetical protein